MSTRSKLVGGLTAALLAGALLIAPSVAGAKVLRVGTYHGIKGQYQTIQAAVDHARPGDWILIGPGDYKTHSFEQETNPDGSKVPAGVLVTRPDIFIRGMNRNRVIVDGTKSGPACNDIKADQNFGPHGEGLNGIEIFEADNDWVQNLTACNFLGGNDGATGNEIWWNGGAGGGHIHGIGFLASYLNGTSGYFHGETTAASYGLFSSDWSGGAFEHDYASNMNDSGFYIGGCSSHCDQTIRDSQAQYNVLGYSGTNSGGSMLFEFNRFDHNQDGFDTNSQNNSDWPSPQNGACPKGVKPQIKGAGTCWIFYKNDVYDNDNPNVPALGAAAAAPVGTGVSIEGENDTVLDNKFTNNGAWGVVFEPYPDSENPPSQPVKAGKACHGGTPNYFFLGFTIKCMYESSGDELLHNTFTHDGYFGNPTNGDFEDATLQRNREENCFIGNRDTRGHLYSTAMTDEPSSYLQTTYRACGKKVSTDDANSQFVFEAACDTEALGSEDGTPIGCTPQDKYPRLKKVKLHKLPTSKLRTMPNPCSDVPKNPWCPAKH